MRKMASAAATLLLLTAACSGPTVPVDAQSTQSVPTIASIAPSSGSVGARATIQGSGFTAAGNTVTFAPAGVAQMPNEPSVIPNLSSVDSRTVVFEVLSVWRPACSYSPPGPCPIANVPTAPGAYGVSVTNSSGTSNSFMFVVTP